MSILLVFLILLIPGASEAQQGIQFPPTNAGKSVGAFLEAFNSTDTSALRHYYTTHLSPQGLQRASVDQRVQRGRSFRSMVGSLTPLKIQSASDTAITLLAKTRDGRKLTMEFWFETAPPNNLAGLMINDAGDDSAALPRALTDSAFIARTGDYLAGLAEHDKFSGVVLVAKFDSVIFQRAYGFANRDEKIPNTLETRFNLGSINKNFTTLAIHQLVARGKLSFDDTLGKILPDYPNKEAATNVTVRELLDMTSGIGDIFGPRYDATPKEKIRSIRDYFPLFADQPLAFKPGTDRRYSNGGFVVLGAIIEQVTGIDYYTYVAKNIYAPAGMTASEWYEKNSTRSDVARGYTTVGGDRTSNYSSLPQRGSSAGGGYSTVGDLLRYTHFLRDKKVIPPTFEGADGLAIAGGTQGVNSMLEWNPRAGYTVIVLSNFDPPTAEEVGRHIRGTLPVWR